MAQSKEPFIWMLFSAGGMISAMVFPVLLLITGFLLPFELAGDGTFERIHVALKHPLIKLILFFVISLPLFHWAHRFRFTLVDIGLKHVSLMITVCCYGGAILGSILTIIVLWNI